MKSIKSKSTLPKKQDKLILQPQLRPSTEVQRVKNRNKKKNLNIKKQQQKLTDRFHNKTVSQTINIKPSKSKGKIMKGDRKKGKKKDQKSFNEVVNRFKKLFDDRLSFIKEDNCPTTDRLQIKKTEPKPKKKSANTTQIGYNSKTNKGFNELLSAIESKLNQHHTRIKSNKSIEGKSHKSRSKSKKKSTNQLKSRQTGNASLGLHKTDNCFSLINLKKSKYRVGQDRTNMRINSKSKIGNNKNRTMHTLQAEMREEPEKFENLDMVKWQISQDQESSSEEQSHDSMIVHHFIDNEQNFKVTELNFKDQSSQRYNDKSVEQWKDQIQYKQNLQQECEALSEKAKKGMEEEEQGEQQIMLNQSEHLQGNISENSQQTIKQVEVSEMFKQEELKWLNLKKQIELIKEGGKVNIEDLDKIIYEAESNHLALKSMQIKQSKYSDRNQASSYNGKTSRKQREGQDYQIELQGSQNNNEKILIKQQNKSINININISTDRVQVSPFKAIEEMESNLSQNIIQLAHNDGYEQPQQQTKLHKTKLSYDEAPLQIRKILKKKGQEQLQQELQKSKHAQQKKIMQEISLLEFISSKNSKGGDSNSSVSEYRSIYEEIAKTKQEPSGYKQKMRKKPKLMISLFNNSDEKNQKFSSGMSIGDSQSVNVPQQTRSFSIKPKLAFVKKYEINEKPQKDNQPNANINRSANTLLISEFQQEPHNSQKQSQVDEQSSIQSETNLIDEGQLQKIEDAHQNTKEQGDYFNQKYNQKQEINRNLFISESKEYSSESEDFDQVLEHIKKNKHEQIDLSDEIIQNNKGETVINQRQVYGKLLPWLKDSHQTTKLEHCNSPNNNSSSHVSFKFYLNKKEQQENQQQQSNCFVLTKPKHEKDKIQASIQLATEELIEQFSMQLLYIVNFRQQPNIIQQIIGQASVYTENKIEGFIQRNENWEQGDNGIQIREDCQKIERDMDYIQIIGGQFINYCIEFFRDDMLRTICKPLGIKSRELLRLMRQMSIQNLQSSDSSFFNFPLTPFNQGEDQIESYEPIISLEFITDFQESLSQATSPENNNCFQQFFNQSVFDYICNVLDDLRPFGRKGLPPLNFFREDDMVLSPQAKFKQIQDKTAEEIKKLGLIKLGVINMQQATQVQIRMSLQRFIDGLARQIEEDWRCQREGEFQFKCEIVNELQIGIIWQQILEIEKIYRQKQGSANRVID